MDTAKADGNAAATDLGGERVPRSLRVTMVDDYELATAGLRALLEPLSDRVTLVDATQALAAPDDIDVILYEPMHQSDFSRSLLRDLQQRSDARALVYTWADAEQLPAASTSACLPKTLPPSRLVHVLESTLAGREDALDPYLPQVESPAPECEPRPSISELLEESVKAAEKAAAEAAERTARRARELSVELPARPAVRAPEVTGGVRTEPSYGGIHLTPREEQILVLVTAGLTNSEIAEHLVLSINSIKTYVRQAYRKIGATRRAQAVAWGLQHGLGRRQDDAEHATAAG